MEGFSNNNVAVKLEEIHIKEEQLDFENPAPLLHLSKTFVCFFCNYKTTGKHSLTLHMLTHISDDLLSCYLCDYRTSKKRLLQIHVKRHVFWKQSYLCDICGTTTKSIGNMSRHMGVHVREMLLYCNLCGYKTCRKWFLKNHMFSHTADKHFKCRLCDFTTWTIGALKIHSRQNHTPRSFCCYLCKYITYKKYIITHHLLSHISEKPYKCTMCDFSAQMKTSLANHIEITHAKSNSLLNCRFCEFTTFGLSSFKRHLESHVDEVPFLCVTCGFSEENQRGFLQHVKGKHVFSHLCNVCGYRAYSKPYLRKHLGTHVGVKSCNLCEYNATLPDMFKHRIKIHDCNK